MQSNHEGQGILNPSICLCKAFNIRRSLKKFNDKKAILYERKSSENPLNKLILNNTRTLCRIFSEINFQVAALN